ncbi:uncharacterized protein LOC131939179 [Physella acuta]|uniref:uncharacterized protein LOC131939179 n=1 Tax=Physella acuta TaxID=109671 RepID=UPI0027DE9E4B|nr:uncharacterized protein LOC131939179 [Physella acuta]
MPSEIKNLTLKEFSEAGGTYDSVLAHCRKQKRLAQLDNELWKPVKGNAEYLECIDEEGEEPTKQSDLAKKTPSSKPKRQGKNSAMPPPTNKNSVLRQVTPSTRMRTRYGQTPLITPKFDPNLPLTPENIRDVKPGERLMSLAGSPVQVEKVNKKVYDVVDKKEIASGWTDIAGVELSPSTVGKMLQFVSNAIKETS